MIERGGEALLVHQLIDLAAALRTTPAEIISDATAERHETIVTVPSDRKMKSLLRDLKSIDRQDNSKVTFRRARYSKIERLVDLLLDRSGEHIPPVRIERIVKSHGIEIRAGDLGDVSGLIVRSW